MNDLQKEIAHIILEELEKGNKELITIMKNFEERLGVSLDESESDDFAEKTIEVLKEHLGIDQEEVEPTASEKELERMKRLL